MNKWIKIMKGKLTESATQASGKSLTLDQLLGNLHKTNPGSLNTSNNGVAWAVNGSVTRI